MIVKNNRYGWSVKLDTEEVPNASGSTLDDALTRLRRNLQFYLDEVDALSAILTIFGKPDSKEEDKRVLRNRRLDEALIDIRRQVDTLRSGGGTGHVIENLENAYQKIRCARDDVAP